MSGEYSSYNPEEHKPELSMKPLAEMDQVEWALWYTRYVGTLHEDDKMMECGFEVEIDPDLAAFELFVLEKQEEERDKQ